MKVQELRCSCIFSRIFTEKVVGVVECDTQRGVTEKVVGRVVENSKSLMYTGF